MKHKKKIMALTIGISLLIGGCGVSESNNDQNGDSNSAEETQKGSTYVSVQDYKGQGYDLNGGEETDKIAEAHREEVDKAVEEFFLNEYKTEVTVHNLIGAKDGATVFVESKGAPHFYTYAIIPIKNEQPLLDGVWSQEGQVEQAIQTGLYRIVNEEAFNQLDKYLENLVRNKPVVGKTEEAIENTGAVGLMTPYYYADVAGDSLKHLYEAYMDNPQITNEELQSVYQPDTVEPEKIFITIQLFMEKKQVQPDKKLFEEICKHIEEAADFPSGSYGIFLNDNKISKSSGKGSKDNTLEKGLVDPIIKK
ncbi:DUF1672 domain-containing protein [Halobacillus shinanisalinarum]|uniref:DUF1672 domain-containing protein n=1 Tax=Halobacillus shinanisalinarum TaxID=2932258 RepID=A0ABY4H2J2_9BACI|nr:DUF1672 family protein [Halobacillus shinanisalinarum]UOQ94675.1 DUF1672 domain-containing protein [Halobacillus shinanisalinarum]